MIIVIDALNKKRYETILQETYRLRARVFRDRLDWDVQVHDGLEKDEFDALDPAHVVSIDEDGNVVGCMRLLQTTGPHMLADVFAKVLDGEPPLRDPQIWEATRFCVDTERLTRKGRAKNSISYVTSEVMVGAFEYGQKAGVLDAVAVIDPVMNRVMIRSGNAPYDYLGKTTDMGKVSVLAALLDCSDERIQRIREFAGIEGNVFLEDEDVVPSPISARHDVAKPEREIHFHKQTASAEEARPAKSHLEEYCDEQIAAASTEHERVAALRLKAALADKIGSHA
ncbi:acyl-homoserine-lactone synthase [Roseovarius tibetensis]|uniref:acyl-homoserine-lactone synthase n=1 Tax=Roseovarius tibetensis TaxID=2685897 RepID=UPI003D7FE341